MRYDAARINPRAERRVALGEPDSARLAAADHYPTASILVPADRPSVHLDGPASVEVVELQPRLIGLEEAGLNEFTHARAIETVGARAPFVAELAVWRAI